MTLDRASYMTMNIWQVKAGDGERDYSKVFLQYGVMLIGSGEEGDYRKHKDKYETIREYRQFAEEAVKGDLVVLKRPWGGSKWAAIAVGKITSGYSFEAVFSDVEDFSLQHCRQVEWKEPAQVKPVPGLSRGGGTFSHVNDERAREEAERLWKEGKRKKSEAIPHEPEELSPKELTDSLTAEGLPRERAKRIADEIERLQQLAEWYEDVGWYDVGEHEARTFLVVPLIKSLGWDEKQVRIEWHYKDVVLFDSPYSQKSKPLILIESKRLGHGLGGAPEQAKEYAELNPTCDRLVVTDGIRYKLFTKLTRFGGWSFSHYMNICTPTRVHQYDPDVAGAVAFLLKMLPKGAM
jgi:hypothetical protein